MRTMKWFLVVALLLLASGCKIERLSGLDGVSAGAGGGQTADTSGTSQPTLR